MSNLQDKVKREIINKFGKYKLLENYRPDWLLSPEGFRMELDLFMPDLNCAIEVQGRQHYVYTPYFHGSYRQFEKQLARDSKKRELCEKASIALYEVSSPSEVQSVLSSIASSNGARISGAKAKYLVHYMIDKMKSIRKMQNRLENRNNKNYTRALDGERSELEKAQRQLEYIMLNCPPTMRAKILKESSAVKYPVTNNTPSVLLIGSDKMRATARKLHVDNLDDGWLVHGVHIERYVTHERGKLICSCENSKKNGTCCHIIAIMMRLGISLAKNGAKHE